MRCGRDNGVADGTLWLEACNVPPSPGVLTVLLPKEVHLSLITVIWFVYFQMEEYLKCSVADGTQIGGEHYAFGKKDTENLGSDMKMHRNTLECIEV